SWISKLDQDLFSPTHLEMPLDGLKQHRNSLELPLVYRLPSLFRTAEHDSVFRERLIASLKRHVNPEEMQLEGVDVLSRPGALPFFKELGSRLYSLLLRHGLYPHLVSGSQGLEPIAAYIVGYSLNRNDRDHVEYYPQS